MSIEIKGVIIGEGKPKVCVPIVESHDEATLVRQRAGVSDDGTDAGLVAGFLQRQRRTHRIPVADAEGGMAHPCGFPHPLRHVARGIEQFVGRMDT